MTTTTTNLYRVEVARTDGTWAVRFSGLTKKHAERIAEEGAYYTGVRVVRDTGNAAS